jgi:NodT family efflux transporter outer membrane factor (OMF) lipoprotein
MRRLLAAGLALALAGCAVGPDHKTPATPASAAGGFASAAPAIAAPAAPPGDWWRLYSDPTLDALVRDALANNTDLRVALANLAEARATLGEARAGRFPTTTARASAVYARNRAFNPNLDANRALQGGIDAAYEVDLFGRVSRAIEAAGANAEALAAAADLVRVSVAAETARAYAEACATGRSAAVARRSVELVAETYDITVRRRDAGGLSDFDVARARALVDQARAAVPSLEGRRRAALYQLAVLTGRPPAEIPAAAEACAAPPTAGTVLPVGDGAALLARRPDVREAERRLAAATAGVGVATASLYPTVSLGGSLTGNNAQPIGGGGPVTTLSYSVGPLITWSFPNVLAARARIKAAEARSAAALARFDGVVLEALRETEASLTAYGAELDRRAALAAARDQAAEAARLARVRYEGGASSFLDLLDAERNLVAAEAQLAASDETLVANQIAVFKALGGGWQAPPTASS